MKLINYLFILLLPLGLFAKEIEWTETDWTLEASGAFYLPASSKVQNLYKGWTDFEVQATKRISTFVDVWGSANWMSKQHSFRLEEYNNVRNKTKIYVLPLSIGCRWIYPILPRTEVYFGVGGCFSFLNIYNYCSRYKAHRLYHAPFRKHLQRTAYGAIFKGGVQYALSNDLFIDFFAHYLWQSFHVKEHRKVPEKYRFKHDLNLNGLKLGIGLGVYF